MPAPVRDHSDAELEELLRTALTARSLQVSERDLRPAQPPVLPARTHRQSGPAAPTGSPGPNGGGRSRSPSPQPRPVPSSSAGYRPCRTWGVLRRRRVASRPRPCPPPPGRWPGHPPTSRRRPRPARTAPTTLSRSPVGPGEPEGQALLHVERRTCPGDRREDHLPAGRRLRRRPGPAASPEGHDHQQDQRPHRPLPRTAAVRGPDRTTGDPGDRHPLRCPVAAHRFDHPGRRPGRRHDTPRHHLDRCRVRPADRPRGDRRRPVQQRGCRRCLDAQGNPQVDPRPARSRPLPSRTVDAPRQGRVHPPADLVCHPRGAAMDDRPWCHRSCRPGPTNCRDQLEQPPALLKPDARP